MARVLILDDEVDIGEFLGLALRREGHDVRAATRPFEAYTTGVEFRPDVLVVDWMLGATVDGIHVSQVLRAGLPQLQVILMTGHPSETLEETASAARISAVLAKPFELTNLTVAIEEATTGGAN